MSDRWLFVVTFGAALGSGLVAGVFFAFSTFVMRGLARLTPPHGIVAMQSINVAAITPAFMAVLFGTGVACVMLAAASILDWRAPWSRFLLAGAVLYVIGTVLVTIVFNVPRNNGLARTNPNRPEAGPVWADFVSSWTAWNTVRTIAALAAAWLLILALAAMGEGGAR